MLGTTNNSDWRDCPYCGDDVHSERWALGYHYCKACGDSVAAAERRSWTVVQQYGKGPYQFVTAATAAEVLHNTNQKQPRA